MGLATSRHAPGHGLGVPRLPAHREPQVCVCVYLLDVQDGAVGWADEDGAVVVDVNDLHVEHGGPPERGMPLVRGHHRQVEPLIGLQAPPGRDEPGVFIDLEGLWGQTKHIFGSGHLTPEKS